MKLQRYPCSRRRESAHFSRKASPDRLTGVPAASTGSGGVRGLTRPIIRTGANERAFTMVEIAIALAIIGFALVAIIGILPAGLNVQKENREETIINQEASIWMNAIRQGAEGMDYLTNYVDAIQITRTELDAFGVPVGPPGPSFDFTRFYSPSEWGDDYILINGFRIVGLLSWPKYEEVGGVRYENSVVAFVRSISGGATEKAPQDNQIVRESAFSYQLTSEVAPFIAHTGPWTNYTDFASQTAGKNNPSSRALSENAHEIRLEFQWPVRPPYDYTAATPTLPENIGNSRQTFRALIGGSYDYNRVDPDVGAGSNSFGFIQSGNFKKPGGGGK